MFSDHHVSGMIRGLLVSVRSPTEAEAALDGGADVIDVKEPLRGPLGRADDGVVADVAAAVAGRRPLSIAAGELVARRPLPSLDAARWVKLGVAGAGGAGAIRRGVRRPLAVLGADRLRLVAYADHAAAGSPPVEEVLRIAASEGLRWAMVDTFDKAGASLFDACSAGRLQRVIARANRAGMDVALAGRLDLGTLADAFRAGADVVGVRGAVCGGDRAGSVRSDAVRRARAEFVAAMGPVAGAGGG